MNKTLFSLLAASTLLFQSCSEDFNVAAPYKDVTVVYGFLDMSDTAHYVRIQKAFLDENKSALTMAKEVDSNFYSNINVRIERYAANATANYVDSIHLDRVDLVQEGYPKEPGVFFNAPSYAYKFKGALNPNFVYRLKIVNLTTGNIDSAEASVIDTAKASFTVDQIDNSSINLAGMNFYSVVPNRNFSIDVQYKAPTTYNYKGRTSPVAIAQAFIKFNWADSNILDKTKVWRSSEYNSGYIGVTTQGFTFRNENQSLYNSLANGMGAAPANVLRYLDRSEITVYLSTSDYVSYINSLALQGSGLTGSEIAPVYTNVSGKNVLGIFTSRAKRTGPITITKRTIDSLMVSPLLNSANIKGTVY